LATALRIIQRFILFNNVSLRIAPEATPTRPPDLLSFTAMDAVGRRTGIHAPSRWACMAIRHSRLLRRYFGETPGPDDAVEGLAADVLGITSAKCPSSSATSTSRICRSQR